jgi:phage N-6-adenine-methyltransferase
MINKALVTMNSEEWETPQDFYDNLHKEFNFTIDVAASKENTKCKKYYTKEDNALIQSWDTEGSVWCNPPYGRQIWRWVKKAYEESFNNTVVLLIPARTDTSYWHDYIFPYAEEVRFIRGRLKFGGSDKEAPFPSAVVVFKNSLSEGEINSLWKVIKLKTSELKK